MAILFDLDGTLTDPKPGIVRSIQFALDRLNVSVPSEDDLEWCIGPPIQNSFAHILETDDPETLVEAVRLYRLRFAEIGLYENAVYPGVPESLEKLRSVEIPLFVATSKPCVFAEKILDHFELRPWFDGIHGSELDGRLSDKGDLIAALMRERRLTPRRTIMIGDREHDVLGARANGIPCLGVTYGYGSEEELDEAGAAALCAKPEGVAEAALSLLAALALSCER